MTGTLVDSFVRKARSVGLALDSGVALLYLLGQHDRSLIHRVRRARVFADEDFDTLSRIVGISRTLATTPHVLTEVTNLFGDLHEPARGLLLASLFAPVAAMHESYRRSKDLLLHSRFGQFELTDTALLCLARRGYAILTMDAELQAAVLSEGFAALNFNHVRTLSWQ